MLLALPGPFQAPAASQGPTPPRQGDPPPRIDLAARYQSVFVTFPELDELLLARFANSKLGRETRLFMLKMKVVDSIGREKGVRAEPQEIQDMLDSVEADVIRSSAARDMDDYLVRQGVTRKQFIESLRLAVLQTKLARTGLGIPPGEPITGEQQEMWLGAQIEARGLKERPAPWEDGIVLESGDVTLGREEFLNFLRDRVDPRDVREALVDLIRVKRMRARMPDLDAETFERAVTDEVENRRIEVQGDPKYKGIPYRQLLESQGILYDRWREDPNIVVAALARLWVQRKYTAEGLREVYENERSFFDAQFGEALEARVLFLRAADVPNELIPLDHEAAEAKLHQLAEDIASQADFEAAVELHSQDRKSRERKGYLGWVTRTGTSGPSPARSALFAALDSKQFKPTDPADSLTRLVGPVRTDAGVLLLWAGQRRPTPSWETMVVHVHKVLRQRFVEEAVEPSQVFTFVDPE